MILSHAWLPITPQTDKKASCILSVLPLHQIPTKLGTRGLEPRLLVYDTDLIGTAYALETLVGIEPTITVLQTASLTTWIQRHKLRKRQESNLRPF